MKYSVFGEESLSKKEKKHLKAIGVIKPMRRGIGTYFEPDELGSSADLNKQSSRMLTSLSEQTSNTVSRQQLNFSPNPS